MGIFAKTKLEFLPDSCRACPLSEHLSPNVEAKCRILRTYMPDGNNERPTRCPLKARAEGVFIDCTAMDKLPGGCEECKMGNRYGCVGDVYCHILNDYFTGNVKPPYKERPDECPLMEATNDKKPSSLLSHADLIGMDGNPVLITFHKDANGSQNKFWALIHIDENSKIYLRNCLGECLNYEDIETEIEEIFFSHGISDIPMTVEELTDVKDEVLFLKWKDDEEVYGEFVLVTKYRPSGINYLCADGSTGRGRYVTHDEDWFAYRLGCNQDAAHEIKKGNNLLSLGELMKLDCEYSPSSIQPVFVHLKETSWGGTCGANVGYASVKFDTEAGTAEVWLVGWDIPATVEISEYGKSWVSYLHKPDFMRTNL